MTRIPVLRNLSLLGLVVAIGCASTTVKKNPGPHDHGLRYYRPKPYLLIQSAEGATDPNVVRVSLDYLPDFSEEYAIHIRTGIGTNKTKLTLDKGWNLTSIDVDVDSKVDEFINSIAGLLGTDPKLLRPPVVGTGPGFVTKTTDMQVTAYNVPLGYYEAVVSKGPDTTKRLYGWRYIGFAPFAQCPIEGTGVACLNCTDADLFGLVTVGNKLYFRKLSEMASTPDHPIVTQSAIPATVPMKAPVTEPPVIPSINK